MMKRILLSMVIIALLFLSQSFASTKQSIDRAACQKAIERVYWAHQIWPKENAQPKPLFESAIPHKIIIAKADDIAKKTHALATYWNKTIDGAQLQAEMEHMAKHSKQPQVLKELWQSLHNDPELIAECLARPILTDNIIRKQYAFDNRFHGQLKAQAASELKKNNTIAQMKFMSGNYFEMVWKKTSNDAISAIPAFPQIKKLSLSNEEWKELTEKIGRIFTTRSLPIGTLSALQEDANRFYVIAILEKTDTQIKIASVSWKKMSFDSWWAKEGELTSAMIEEPRFDYTLPAIAMAGCVSDTWEPTSWVPRPRSNFSTVWTGTEMIVFGGLDENASPQGTGGRYNPSTDSWTPLSIFNEPNDRDNHTAVWTGTEMIVWGGCALGTCDITHNSGGKYNPVTDTWTPTTLSGAAHNRYFHTAVWTGTEMIVWGGGYIYQGNLTVLNTGGKYNPATDSWADTSTTNAPSERYIHSAVWTGSAMIVWGGESMETPAETNSGGMYDPGTDTWTATSLTDAPVGRWRNIAIWSGSEMIVWGGMDTDGNLLDTGGKLNPVTNTWTATSMTNVPAARWRASAVWAKTAMIVWGGQGNEGFLNSGSKYNPGTDTWTAISTSNAPDPRMRHGSVWTGAEMIIWGGFNGTYLSSGGRYFAAYDTWIPMYDEFVPWERYAHTATWTGTEMIIWGGYDDFDYYSMGGKYRPGTDSWSSVTSFDEPSPRSGHTAIWTGNQMIIWGGTDSAHFYNDGARYNPATDRWVLTTTTDAASNRESHTAVWTGVEMIVWGGEDGNNWLDTGGKYNPYTDSWTPTSTTSAPVGRLAHTAVWTGTKMLIWGGFYGDFTNTGGTYDPIIDSWTDTATTDAPSARQNHTAVWTGSEMIVWGGVDASSALNSGGRYNLASNSWTATDTASAPSARTAHIAGWAQTAMIIWGGFDGASTYFGDGAKYTPSTDTWTAMSTTNAPTARYNHSAVVTPEEIIIWGGHVWNGNRYVNLNTGALYCAPQSIAYLVSHKPMVDDAFWPGNPYVNGIIEPDEDIELIGELTNAGTTGANSVTGDLGTFDPTITMWDSLAAYPTIAPGATVQCTNCYELQALASNRPATHWDFAVVEWPHCTTCQQYSSEFIYHIGYSFSDVPPTNLFYTYIEKLLHSNVTSGCTATQYCPGSTVQRQAMAKFICKAMEAKLPGSCPVSACGEIFADVPSSNPFCSYIEALYNLGVLAGCQDTPDLLFCPDSNTNRQAMAKFLCIGMETVMPGSCTPAACSGTFQDVPASNPFCGYIEALYNANVASGCQSSPLRFCPTDFVLRNQMAKFIVIAFGFTL